MQVCFQTFCQTSKFKVLSLECLYRIHSSRGVYVFFLFWKQPQTTTATNWNCYPRATTKVAETTKLAATFGNFCGGCNWTELKDCPMINDKKIFFSFLFPFFCFISICRELAFLNFLVTSTLWRMCGQNVIIATMIKHKEGCPETTLLCKVSIWMKKMCNEGKMYGNNFRE